MGRSMALNAFLGHQTRTGSSQFLSGWRKRNPPEVDVVLHTKAPIVALWQHGLPRIFEQKDNKTNSVTRRVFGGSFNCLEDESVLLKQYRRDKATGERVLPPVLCPMCRLQEALLQCYEDETIGFADTVFRWEGDDPSETQVLTLGGMLNLYGKDELEDHQKEAMADAGIKLSEAWKENSYSKCNYLFVVVDSAEPEAGVQLAIETTLLGDQVKECIHGQMTSLGEEDGNPMLNPYAIRWKHSPNAREFNKRYKAIAMPKIAITSQIQELIDGEPPDTENVIKPGNITKLRAELEARCVLDDPSVIPWDDIFGPAEKAGYGQPEADEEEGEDAAEKVEATTKAMTTRRRAAAAKPEAKPDPAPSAGRRRKKVEPEPEPEPEEEEVEEEDVAEETIPCDECGHPMGADETTCPKCGAEYEVDAEPEPEPKPKPAASKKTSKKTGKGGKTNKIPF